MTLIYTVYLKDGLVRRIKGTYIFVMIWEILELGLILQTVEPNIDTNISMIEMVILLTKMVTL